MDRLFFTLLPALCLFCSHAGASGTLTGTDFFTRNDSVFLTLRFSGNVFPYYESFQNKHFAVYLDDCKNLLDIPLPERTFKRFVEKMDWITLPSVMGLTFQLSDDTFFEISAQNRQMSIIVTRPPAPCRPAPCRLVRYDTGNIEYAAFFAPLPEHVLKRVKTYSWRENCPVNTEDLAYLRLSHLGPDDSVHTGELIVHRGIALEVLDIFGELFEQQFPIEKMRLIDEYQGNDDLSMADNNTSAFNCRNTTFGKEYSNHAYGVAIDINPVLNPYVYRNSTRTLPPNGRSYVNRSKDIPGMIHRDGPCYKAFTCRGWRWGGDWQRSKDYQHFEK